LANDLVSFWKVLTTLRALVEISMLYSYSSFFKWITLMLARAYSFSLSTSSASIYFYFASSKFS
jgi:hypothetical protein